MNDEREREPLPFFFSFQNLETRHSARTVASRTKKRVVERGRGEI